MTESDTSDFYADPAVDVTPPRPALFARFGGLPRLRYDFPLVLVEDDVDGPVLRPLTAIIDGILSKTATPGAAGEALRQQVLRLEGVIRERVAHGERATLVNHWRRCWAIGSSDACTR